jgi:RNA polymerase sigma-70 factor (ECF subfamily)
MPRKGPNPDGRTQVTKKQKDEALSEKEIVHRVRAGEIGLFELLFRRHRQRVYRVARAIVRDDAEAADVVQEAYLRAYTHLGQFAGRAAFSTWLTKIAVYLAWERARLRGRQKEKRTVAASGADAAELEIATGSDPERQAFGKEVKTILETAIDALPDRYRAVFMMREIEEMSTAETAECLSLSQDTVKTRLHRARALLRGKLYASMGPLGAEAFRFGGLNCQRMWAALFLKMKLKTHEKSASSR